MVGADPGADPASDDPVGAVLVHGAMEVLGRFAGSSNTTLLVTCTLDGTTHHAVYKPERGERPLWDFPRGLWRREVAAYRLAGALGWDLVPLTVRRTDAPYGEGSVQLLVSEDGESHYFTLRDNPAHRDALVRVAVLDVVANNADRKSGHVLLAGGQLWAIDHGLCFHVQPKLRTVIWDFAGERLPGPTAAALTPLAEGAVPAVVAELLEPAETAALQARAADLLAAGTLPVPDDDGDWPPYPWPLV